MLDAAKWPMKSTSRRRRWLGRRPTLLIIPAISFIGLMLHGTSSMCGNKILNVTPSPDGKLTAITFQRDCGGTTDLSSQVSILPAPSSLPRLAGNTFISDTSHGAAPVGPGGGPALVVRWLSSSSLTITHHAAARIFLAQRRVAGVDVQYATFSRETPEPLLERTASPPPN